MQARTEPRRWTVAENYPFTMADAVLTIEALRALVLDEYPSLPLADLARTWGGGGLTQRHYLACERVEQALFPAELEDGGDD